MGDESTGTCASRLKDIGMEGTIEEQRGYRQMLYSTPGLSEHIAGAIMFEKTLYESSDDGVPFVKLLGDQGILAGIKVDTGLKKIDGTDGAETWTSGLDTLKERCAKYYEQGARFAKWRNVVYITDNTPSDAAILDCVTTLAQYAATCQSEGLVPIVEPEVSLDGDHDIETCKEVTRRVWKMQYEVLQQYGVLMEGMLFKPAMIVPGAEAPKETPQKVAKYTLDVMKETVPPTMSGITFLSGGQSEEDATLHIQAMAVHAGRALECLLLFRPRSAVVGLEGMGREKGERAEGPGAAARDLPGERPRADGQVPRRACGPWPSVDDGVPLREGIPVLSRRHAFVKLLSTRKNTIQ